MSTYKEINGTAIEALSADPPNPQDGQVWYRTDLGIFKNQKQDAGGAWATGADINQDRLNSAGAGNNTAAVAFGDPIGRTETYNGTSWIEVNDMNNGRSELGGAGNVDTAALAFGGNPSPPAGFFTESWNGTNWTELNDLGTARYKLSGAGTSTAALGIAGYQDTGAPATTEELAITELWNGTNWTEVNDLNAARFQLAAAGTSTAALAFGGQSDAENANGLTESWNGTNWTEVNDLNRARKSLGGFGATNTSALAFGGLTPSDTTETELWNGTSWTQLAAQMNDQRHSMGSAGTTSNGLAFAGNFGPNNTKTEEWNSPATVIETITIE